MKRTAFFKAHKQLIILFVIAFLIKLISFFPNWVEEFYIPKLWQPFAKLQRILTGWIPFSLGDIIYASIIIWFIYSIYKTIKYRKKEKWTKNRLWNSIQKLFIPVLYIYIVFSLVWGINYARKGIAYQLHLKAEKYDQQDIENVLTKIIVQLNNIADSIPNPEHFGYAASKKMALEGYAILENSYPFIHYENASIKKTLFGRIENYMGFMGYYNPFTGEAQINTTVPSFAIPNVVAHEMAHQIGYAKEDEANFVAFLNAKNSKHIALRYSGYFDVLQYCSTELYHIDSNAVKKYKQQMHPTVRRHLVEWKQFYKSHQSFVSTLVMWIYNQYLKANDMPQGIATYNQVVALLIAYNKKYGL
jgi:Protein of unknown function (DUF3810)